MRKFGYLLFNPKSNDMLYEIDYLNYNGCSVVFMDPFNFQKEYPQFEFMLTLCKPNDVLIVSDLSYLASTFEHLIKIVQVLRNRSINLICADQNINTKNQEINQLIFLIEVFNHLHKREIKTKFRKTVQKNKQEGGRLLGAPKGMKRRTYNKAVETYRLKQEGKLSKEEIIELLDINRVSFYQYCKMGDNGLLTPDLMNLNGNRK
ncbi:MAG: recombinase family protein [Cyclobacteriaceae bacterium]